ncbi:sulfurtransferase complex subunit TusC [Marinospirillum alkaliphilum]|uniref:tRNA 2-thiouridine synthesizing protein C n=1 Tax=Marinospirillum alkaliphilum DSM 21637 TaxID=1122209 RepID=A0A1K1TVQ8_9GAMM|nr:sulfurtransferase complex subunit TusC [Marinospirillum alkaliphilum]SFX04396.1 tRNA 2-thiouridine synthesizing protein C [Marinospirillum alkaliphilum DSM 21637]
MSTSTLDLLVIFSHPPLTGLRGREGLDVALVSSTFDQNTALLFMGEGVLQLLPDQQPDCLQLKGTQAMLKALPLYDLDQVYVEEAALLRYGLSADKLLLPVQPLNNVELQQLLQRSRHLLSH